MRWRLAAAIAFTTLIAACSGGDPDAGPAASASLLVGHWSSAGDDNLYFGAVDAATDTGSYILVHPDGKSFAHRYRVESVEGRTIHAMLMFASGNSRAEAYAIAPDGRSLESETDIDGIVTRSRLTRVDDSTAP